MRDSSLGQLLSDWEKIWKSWAPGKCSFFMWLVAHDRYWTADRLARQGLPHLESCPMCDQAPEYINHLLVNCTFAREFWFHFFSQVGLQTVSPQLSDYSFYNCWEWACNNLSGMQLQCFNSLTILGASTLWTQRNRCVFDGATPEMAQALTLASEERKL
jgi:hypothetical protein